MYRINPTVHEPTFEMQGHLETQLFMSYVSHFDPHNMVLIYSTHPFFHEDRRDVWIWDILSDTLVTWQGNERIIGNVRTLFVILNEYHLTTLSADLPSQPQDHMCTARPPRFITPKRRSICSTYILIVAPTKGQPRHIHHHPFPSPPYRQLERRLTT